MLLVTTACLATFSSGERGPQGESRRAIRKSAHSPFPLRCGERSILDGDYEHFAVVAMATPENAGDIANIGIIIGQDA